MPTTSFHVSQPFAPRAVRAGPVMNRGGWRLKTYGLACCGRPELPDETAGVPEILDGILPDPPATDGRAGVGFLLVHEGSTADYLVIGWWDRENEMPVRVHVREQGNGATWRPAGEGESFCVWDLEVMKHERDAWIRHVLDQARGDIEAYLADPFPGT